MICYGPCLRLGHIFKLERATLSHSRGGLCNLTPAFLNSSHLQYDISDMLFLAPFRHVGLVCRGISSRQWLNVKTTYTCYSTLSSSIKITSIPAPHSGSITVLSLNRPSARNALSRGLLGEISDVVEGLHREGGRGSTRALIVASESDNAFCAGADLKERLTMSTEEYVHTHEVLSL